MASVITNIAISALGKKGAKLSDIKDFMIDWDGTKPRQVQSTETMKEVLMGMIKNSKKSK